jgi:hypothetical protein
MATQVALAQSTPLPPIQITMGTTPQAGDLAIPLQILLLLTLLSFIPALLIAMTSWIFRAFGDASFSVTKGIEGHTELLYRISQTD